MDPITRRELFRRGFAAAAVLTLPAPLLGCRAAPPEESGPAESAGAAPPVAGPDEERLVEWVRTLRDRGHARAEVPLGSTAIAVGELAVGTPYVAQTLEEYLLAGGSPMRAEPLTLSLTRFDCVTLVESCLAVARVARAVGEPRWESFAREMERMRYRGGERGGYTSRLHYFSEWMDDGARRGLVRVIGEELDGEADRRPLRFMSEHPDAYPAMAEPGVREEIAAIERSLDDRTRWVVPTERIESVQPSIRTGDVLGFATSIAGLDVTHSAFAYRDEGGVLRVLHAPLSGGVVEVTRTTLPDYVRAIRRSTGILVARPV